MSFSTSEGTSTTLGPLSNRQADTKESPEDIRSVDLESTDFQRSHALYSDVLFSKDNSKFSKEVSSIKKLICPLLEAVP